jgi:hypothetical protein
MNSLKSKSTKISPVSRKSIGDIGKIITRSHPVSRRNSQREKRKKISKRKGNSKDESFTVISHPEKIL